MELKQRMGLSLYCTLDSTNRTIMELKPFRAVRSSSFSSSTNRTIMELKLEMSFTQSVSVRLLIAPLWN